MRSKRLLTGVILLLTIIAIFFVFLPTVPFHLGLDLQGGTQLTLEADMRDIEVRDRSDALEGAKAVIERRVNFLGVSEPVIQTAKVADSHRIIVELPGIKDVAEAVALVGKTAQLEFMERNQATESAQLFIPTGVTGRDLKRAYVSFDPNTGTPEISFELTSEGGKKFKEVTTRILAKKETERQLTIVLDGQIISDPTVQSVIEDRGRITGRFTTKEAKTLAIQLNAGALPVPLKILQQRAIGATLGAESVKKSMVAGAIGFAVVSIFMVLFYRSLGMFAVLALVIYTLLVLAVFKLVAVTLTLAGIAGFILSIGMAVDANILIFERFKEEVRWGKPKHVSLELGFQRAWTSIRDSNVSSLITSAILYAFGSGIVKGFALVLAIGVFVSMFSAIIVTRTLLRLLYRNN